MFDRFRLNRELDSLRNIVFESASRIGGSTRMKLRAVRSMKKEQYPHFFINKLKTHTTAQLHFIDIINQRLKELWEKINSLGNTRFLSGTRELLRKGLLICEELQHILSSQLISLEEYERNQNYDRIRDFEAEFHKELAVYKKFEDLRREIPRFLTTRLIKEILRLIQENPRDADQVKCFLISIVVYYIINSGTSSETSFDSFSGFIIQAGKIAIAKNTSEIFLLKINAALEEAKEFIKLIKQDMQRSQNNLN